MTVSEIRKRLRKKQMDLLTEKALSDGPFLVQNITQLGKVLDIEVYYPETNKRKTIQI